MASTSVVPGHDLWQVVLPDELPPGLGVRGSSDGELLALSAIAGCAAEGVACLPESAPVEWQAWTSVDGRAWRRLGPPWVTGPEARPAGAAQVDGIWFLASGGRGAVTVWSLGADGSVAEHVVDLRDLPQMDARSGGLEVLTVYPGVAAVGGDLVMLVEVVTDGGDRGRPFTTGYAAAITVTGPGAGPWAPEQIDVEIVSDPLPLRSIEPSGPVASPLGAAAVVVGVLRIEERSGSWSTLALPGDGAAVVGAITSWRGGLLVSGTLDGEAVLWVMDASGGIAPPVDVDVDPPAGATRTDGITSVAEVGGGVLLGTAHAWSGATSYGTTLEGTRYGTWWSDDLVSWTPIRFDTALPQHDVRLGAIHPLGDGVVAQVSANGELEHPNALWIGRSGQFSSPGGAAP